MRRIHKTFERVFRRRSDIYEPSSRPHPTHLSRPAMAPKGLLRQLFRDLQPRIDIMRSLERVSSSPVPPPRTVSQDKMATLPMAAPLEQHTPPYAHVPANLEVIAEESDTDSATVGSDSIDSNDTFFKTFAALDLDASTATTRQLLETTVHEATAALRSHLESLTTTLALLEALDGFSQTITVLKSEMLNSQEECRTRLRLMGDFQNAIDTMYWDDDMVVTGQDDESGKGHRQRM